MPNINEHFKYTVDEWKNEHFQRITDALPDRLKVVYDVGANVGGWAHVMQEKYENTLTMFCFEPVKENVEMLLSKGIQAQVEPYGIFYGATESHVCSRGDGNCGGIFVEHINAGNPIVQTEEIITLKTFEELDLPKPDLIKMDVEGAEENIIEHSSLVKETRWLLIEWHPQFIDPIDFFQKNLPNHEVVVNLLDNQFLLCLKQ